VAKIEDLIYQRDCVKSLVEKTFESLKSLTEKLNKIEKDINLTDKYFNHYKFIFKRIL